MRQRPLFAWVALCTLMGLTTLLLLRRDPPSFDAASSRPGPGFKDQSAAHSFPAPVLSQASPSQSQSQSQSPPLPPGPAHPDDYLRELEHLSQTDKARALRFVDAADDWFPRRGVQAEAREAMRITLLAELGHIDKARTFVRTFIQEHPESRYRPLVQGVTGIFPRPGAPTP